MTYKSGIAVKQEKKAIKDVPLNRNPKGTTKEQLRYKYNHPDYCTSLRHADARSGMCYTHKLRATQREVVLKEILDEAVQKRVQNGLGDGTYMKSIESCINYYKCF